MPPPPSRSHPPRRYGYLVPFGLLAAGGFAVLAGWWSGQVTWVQPRSYDAPLPANAALCFALLGLVPLVLAGRWNRAAVALTLLVAGLAGATLVEHASGAGLGIDQLLVRHESLVAGPRVARMPAALAGVCLAAALMLAWFALRPTARQLNRVFGLGGSLVLAYGFTGLLAYRNGLNLVAAWQTHAQVGPHTAGLLLLLGASLIGLAIHRSPGEHITTVRWLWLPMVVSGVTITFSFWISLRERELAYQQGTTQLTMDYVAALFGGEAESQIKSVTRFARRAPSLDRGEWERDVARYIRDFDGCRSVQFVDASLHTTWFWPHEGNEDAPSLDHGSVPARRVAINAARQSQSWTLAAPLDVSSNQRPSFAVYVPAIAADASDAFVVGEFFYDSFFDSIDRRLNLTRRYRLEVAVDRDASAGAAPLPVFQSSAGTDQLDPRLTRTEHYNVAGQHLTISLTPRPGWGDAGRQHLPDLMLGSGLAVSLLLGLVTRLAQAAFRRQRAAEETSRQLRIENEERRRVEIRLQKADERLNLAFESTQAGVFEWDVETDEVFCTPSIWKMIGADASEMPATGAAWLNLLHPDDRPAVRSVIDAHFRGDTPLIEIEHCIHLKSGEWMWVAFRAKCTSFSAARHPRRVLGTVQNITARKRADEALRASQAETRKLSLVASRTDNAVVIADAAGRIEWANASYARLSGRSPRELARLPVLASLASPEADAGALERITAALKQGQPIATEAVQVAADGRRFHVHLDVQPITNDDGEVENFIIIATDITARVETERQLRRAKDEADAVSRAKSEFLASMSHEIRTPLNGVIGMASLLVDTELTPEQRDYINTIRTSGDSLLSIINEILDFSKIEAGGLQLETQPLELTQCLEEVVDIFTGPSTAKGLELAYAIDPAVPPCLLGDVTRLRQILMHLVGNAVKFTEQGVITIEAHIAAPLPAGEAPFRLDFHVTDSGIGIPPERRHLLFQPFSQVDGSTTRKFGGTGLGLAICRRLCELMGGGIELAAHDGPGSRFHFWIQTNAVALDGGASPMFPPLTATGAVLAVDDLALNRATLRTALERWGLTPRIAATVDEALTVSQAGPLAAAIVDQDLAGTSGLDLVRQLRAAHPTAPVIVLASGPSAMQRRETGLDALVSRVPKPLKPYPVYEALRRALAAATTAAAPAATPARLAETIPLQVLLVEDNLVNQKVAAGYLQRFGYKPATAVNGVEAVNRAKTLKFDLILMDLQMPEMDGITATAEIRRALPDADQPVILALTANAMPGDRQRCLAAGMNDYLSKPVKAEDLQAAILRHFGSRKSSAS